MTIGIPELDKISHLPFETFLLVACAPIDVLGCEFGFPLVKRVTPTDVKTNVVKHRLRSRTRGQAMWIAIDPHIRHISIGRVGSRKPQHVMGETRECFTIRHAEANLHNVLYRTHGRFPFVAKSAAELSSLNLTACTTAR